VRFDYEQGCNTHLENYESKLGGIALHAVGFNFAELGNFLV
jgi:hypothetical protein